MSATEIDTNRLFLMMDTLRDVLISKGRDGEAAQIVLSNTKALARTIVNFTPPIRERGGKGSPRANGEDKIEKQLTSLFTEVEPKTIDEIGSIHGIHNVNAWLSAKDGTRLNLQWENIDPNATRMREYHDKYRNSRGVVPIARKSARGVWKARVVVPQGSRKPYIKGVQARVGRAKCSMGKIGMMLADDYPSWIARHKGSVGDIAIASINTSNPAFPSVTFGSRAPGISQIRDRVRGAVRMRVNVIHRHIKLVLNDYKDWRSVRAKANARKNGEVPGERKETVE